VSDSKEIFNKFKNKLLMLDPVSFIENYLMLDGKPFRLNGSGYKPFIDIYRYAGVKALEKTGKPMILVKSRQVGGTTMASALEMYFMGSGLFGNGFNPPIRVIHAFPQLEHAAAYSKTKLNPMIVDSIDAMDKNPASSGKRKSYMQSLLDTTSDTNNSLHFKQFSGGNHIWIESTGLNADRLRGRKYGRVGDGVQIYFGTPKKKGSDYYKMWNVSNQQYYYLGCENCKKHFPLYTPESDDWEKIWLHGFIVKCTHCNHEQDKRQASERGKWISSRPDEESIMVGFHINQLYMPDFTKEKILSEKPGIHPTATERSYRNEVLGEFFQGDSSPITPEEIRELCGDLERKMRASVSVEEDLIVTMGIDYGLKSNLEEMADVNKTTTQGQSYSTAVILTAKGPQLLSIEFCTKFKRNDEESKRSLIDQLMRQYSVKLAIGDIGFSQEFSEKLHIAYGDRYLVSRAHNTVNGHIKYNKEVFPKEIIFQKNFYYSELIEQMKGGKIRFPLGDYEKIAWLIQHCSNNDIKPSLSRGGDPTVHYVKSGPNDGFAALLNAYLAYKFIVTNGLLVKNPLLINGGDGAKPMVLGGYIKRRI